MSRTERDEQVQEKAGNKAVLRWKIEEKEAREELTAAPANDYYDTWDSLSEREARSTRFDRAWERQQH